jgi:uncharacterized protein (TIGR01569 family)
MSSNNVMPAERQVQIQIQDGKMGMGIGMDSSTMSGPLVAHSGILDGDYEKRPAVCKMQMRFDLANVGLRVLSLACSVVALVSMASNQESGVVTVFGFKLPVYSKWSYSDSFEFLVGASAAAAAHSLLQLLLCGMKMVKRASTIPSRNHAWLLFAGDQVFAYGMLAAASAAAGVTNLNRTGFRHSDLPNFCKPLHRFCDKAAISIVFAFISSLLLGGSAVLDVFWLSKN